MGGGTYYPAYLGGRQKNQVTKRLSVWGAGRRAGGKTPRLFVARLGVGFQQKTTNPKPKIWGRRAGGKTPRFFEGRC
jgi:hypothetical protein